MNYPRDGALAEFRYRLRRPKLLAQGINILYYKALDKIGSLESGLDVVNADWDNLVILDGCRYDAFEAAFTKRSDLTGDLRAVRSQGPYTNEFLSANFGGRRLHDTVYVTSSPHIYKSNRGERGEIDDDFHDIIHAWFEDHHPSTLTEAALETAEAYPNKRLVIHYIPPHWPYFGPMGEDLFEEYDNPPWEELTSGEVTISRENLWETYEENLEIGLDHVEELISDLDGKTVVTGDHGQLLGDREFPIPVRGYGHPGVYVDALVEVPWLECPYETRRDIVSEDPNVEDIASDEAEDAAMDTLADLGYVE
jgi:hypothetical protein